MPSLATALSIATPCARWNSARLTTPSCCGSWPLPRSRAGGGRSSRWWPPTECR
nr:MAG TPA: hypothetical protein [Caudoviricetes sp.]DAU70025.1 MAG TPA: hypothetical protein [Caudoviricetes sp.]